MDTIYTIYSPVTRSRQLVQAPSPSRAAPQPRHVLALDINKINKNVISSKSVQIFLTRSEHVSQLYIVQRIVQMSAHAAFNF